MRTTRVLLTLLTVLGPVGAAWAADGLLLVTGKTSPGDAERVLGMPVNMRVERNGALTLIYPMARMPLGAFGNVPVMMLAASGVVDDERSVMLHFSADLTYDGYAVTGASPDGGIGLAAR